MNYVIPCLIILLFIYALIRGVDPYAAFCEGAKEAIPTVIGVIPYLGAMLMTIRVFRSSGSIDILNELLAPVFKLMGIPVELATLIVIRPFSGSAALAVLKDVLNQYGPDSFIGRAASICVGSTETIMYTVALYCGSVNIRRTRHAIPVAVLSGIAGVVSAVYLAKIMPPISA